MQLESPSPSFWKVWFISLIGLLLPELAHTHSADATDHYNHLYEPLRPAFFHTHGSRIHIHHMQQHVNHSQQPSSNNDGNLFVSLHSISKLGGIIVYLVNAIYLIDPSSHDYGYTAGMPKNCLTSQGNRQATAQKNPQVH